MTDPSELPLAETIFTDADVDPPAKRDRIVILGRRTAGKTVYLSVLYEKYWKSLDGLTMKAVSGQVHGDCVRVVEGLHRGNWPAATLETQHCDLEIEYKGQRHLLVALDYAGELFHRAFVQDIIETPETKELVRHIDAAAAVILLIDAASATGSDVDAAIDDDFGMTQAVTRIRNWPGGKRIPVALAFTKADENRHIIAREGGLEKFVKKRFPALARTLQRAALFQVSAVRSRVADDGSRIPRTGFCPENIEAPLLYCLRQIDLHRELDRQESFNRSRKVWLEQQQRQDANRERRYGRRIALIIVSMFVVAACVVALVWAYKS